MRCSASAADQSSGISRRCTSSSTTPTTGVNPPAALAALAPTLTVIVSVAKRERAQIDTWAEDVLRQTFRGRWELVAVSVNSAVLDHLASALQRGLGNQTFTLTTLHLPKLLGHFELSDVVVRESTAEFLSTWNLDHRKRPSSLFEKLAFLREHPEVDLLTCAVHVTRNLTDWAHVPPSTRAFWARPTDGPLFASDLVQTQPETGLVLATENIPHSAPVWRRRVHAEFGLFSQGPWRSPAPPTADYLFWLRMLLAFKRAWHIGRPLEIYHEREPVVVVAPGRRRLDPTRRAHAAFSQQLLERLGYLGLYNNDSYQRWFCAGNRSLHVLVAHERMPLAFGTTDLRLRELIEWLVWNGHTVTFVGRGRDARADLAMEAHAWMDRRGVAVVADGAELLELAAKLPELPPFDTVLAVLDFERAIRQMSGQSGQKGRAKQRKSAFRLKTKVAKLPREDLTLPELLPQLFSLQQHSPNAQTAVVTHKVHWRRCYTPGAEHERVELCLQSVRAREAASYAAAKLVLVLRAKQRESVLEMAPSAAASVLPMASPVQAAALDWLAQRGNTEPRLARTKLARARLALERAAPQQPGALRVSVLVEDSSSGLLRMFVGECALQLMTKHPGLRLRILGARAAALVQQARDAKRKQDAWRAGFRQGGILAANEAASAVLQSLRAPAGGALAQAKPEAQAVCVDDEPIARALLSPPGTPPPSLAVAGCPAGLYAYDGVTDLHPFLISSDMAIVLAESRNTHVSSGTLRALSHGLQVVTTSNGWLGLGCSASGPRSVPGPCRNLHVADKLDCGSLTFEFEQALQARNAMLESKERDDNSTLALTKEKWLSDRGFMSLFMRPIDKAKRPWP